MANPLGFSQIHPGEIQCRRRRGQHRCPHPRREFPKCGKGPQVRAQHDSHEPCAQRGQRVPWCVTSVENGQAQRAMRLKKRGKAGDAQIFRDTSCRQQRHGAPRRELQHRCDIRRAMDDDRPFRGAWLTLAHLHVNAFTHEALTRPAPRETDLDQNDLTLIAMDRLEAALEHLALVLQARLAASLPPAAATVGPPADMVPRAEVERISARLDEALGRLRMLLGEDAGAEV